MSYSHSMLHHNCNMLESRSDGNSTKCQIISMFHFFAVVAISFFQNESYYSHRNSVCAPRKYWFYANEFYWNVVGMWASFSAPFHSEHTKYSESSVTSHLWIYVYMAFVHLIGMSGRDGCGVQSLSLMFIKAKQTQNDAMHQQREHIEREKNERTQWKGSYIKDIGIALCFIYHHIWFLFAILLSLLLVFLLVLFGVFVVCVRCQSLFVNYRVKMQRITQQQRQKKEQQQRNVDRKKSIHTRDQSEFNIV